MRNFLVLDSKGILQPTRCSLSLTGNISHIVTRQICKAPYSDQCKFFANDPAMATASVMFDSQLNGVRSSCFITTS